VAEGVGAEAASRLARRQQAAQGTTGGGAVVGCAHLAHAACGI
jgi:hypothetical protein